jgi:hypothetical protein
MELRTAALLVSSLDPFFYSRRAGSTGHRQTGRLLKEQALKTTPHLVAAGCFH